MRPRRNNNRKLKVLINTSVQHTRTHADDGRLSDKETGVKLNIHDAGIAAATAVMTRGRVRVPNHRLL